VVYDRQQQRFLNLPEGMALERGLSDDTSHRIDMAVRALVDEAFARASALLAERRALLQEGADKLLAQETLTEADLLPLAEAARRKPAV
jgi:ATP-dependent Zn proteases